MITSHPNLPVLYLISLIITIIIIIPSALIIISIIIIGIRKMLNSIGNIGHTNPPTMNSRKQSEPSEKEHTPQRTPSPLCWLSSSHQSPGCWVAIEEPGFNMYMPIRLSRMNMEIQGRTIALSTGFSRYLSCYWFGFGVSGLVCLFFMMFFYMVFGLALYNYSLWVN